MTERTDIFFDFEFIDDGREIVPISVGMCVTESTERRLKEDSSSPCFIAGDKIPRSTELYLEYKFDPARCNDWVRENVFPHLHHWEGFIGTGHKRSFAAHKIKEWVKQVCGDTQPQFWGYYPSYDWVCLAQHFGNLTQKPEGWPYGVRCLEQWAEMLAVPQEIWPPQDGQTHNALVDAKWNRDLHTFLSGVQAGRESKEQ